MVDFRVRIDFRCKAPSPAVKSHIFKYEYPALSHYMGLLDSILFTDNAVFVGVVLGGFFLLGLFFLVKGSDVFIDGAASIARKRGISEHTIGLTLVAFATSIPELAVSVFAAANGKADIAVGNVVGSNVANMCLVLGVSILIMDLKTSKSITKNTIIMIGVTALLYLFAVTGKELSRFEGAVFLLIYVGFFYYTFKFAEEEDEDEEEAKERAVNDLLLVAVGAVGVTLGASLLIESAVEMASRVGISELIIGLTIISVGTSLPELASSATAAKKGKHGISIGNVIGSNIINIVLVLGTVALISPVSVADKVTNLTMPILMLISFLMLFFVKGDLRRGEGYVLLGIYVVFLVLLAGVV